MARLEVELWNARRSVDNEAEKGQQLWKVHNHIEKTVDRESKRLPVLQRCAASTGCRNSLQACSLHSFTGSRWTAWLTWQSMLHSSRGKQWPLESAHPYRHFGVSSEELYQRVEDVYIESCQEMRALLSETKSKLENQSLEEKDDQRSACIRTAPLSTHVVQPTLPRAAKCNCEGGSLSSAQPPQCV